MSCGRVIAGLVFLLGAVAGACSSDTEASHAGDAPADADAIESARRAACEDFAIRFCEAAAKCDPAGFAGTFASIDDCKTRKVEQLMIVEFTPGSMLENAADPAVCLGAFDYSTCSATIRALTGSVGMPAACPRGGGADGTPCYFAESCAGGVCLNGNPTGCGLCGRLAEAGQPCQNSGDCVAGLYCDATCKPRGELGAACTVSSQCQGDLACVAGACAPRLALGASSAGDDRDPCAFDPPSRGNAVSGKCVPIDVVPVGAACGTIDGDRYALCSAAGRCDGASMTTSGTCVKRTGDGEPCTLWDDCVFPAMCFQGKCRMIAGDVCAYPAP